jgi:hypothetical protein
MRIVIPGAQPFCHHFKAKSRLAEVWIKQAPEKRRMIDLPHGATNGSRSIILRQTRGIAMFKPMSKLCLIAAITTGLLGFGLTSPAQAQDASTMSCGELWHARNAIYARRGHCFDTDRGRAAFGPGCFPPFGQLSGYEKGRVNELQSWERRRGC